MIFSALALATAINTGEPPCFDDRPATASRATSVRPVASAPRIKPASPPASGAKPTRKLRRLKNDEYPCAPIETVPVLPPVPLLEPELPVGGFSPAPDGFLYTLPEIPTGSVIEDAANPATCDCFAGYPIVSTGNQGWYGGGVGVAPVNVNPPIPEPTTAALLAFGIAALIWNIKARKA